MIKRKLIIMVAACALALAACLASVTSASGATATSASSPGFCSNTASIPAADLATGVALSNCPIQGRLVTRSVGGTHIGARVPSPGHVEAVEATTVTGDYVLALANQAGRVTSATSFPAGKSHDLPRAASPDATDPACTETGVAYLNFVWNKTLQWYYNQSTVSRAGLNGPTTLTSIRAANTNMTNGVNNCGWPQANFGSYIGGVPLGAYQGTTSKYANIDSSGDITSNFPDGQNTVSWGPFNNTEEGTLAITAFDYNTGGNQFAIEADTYLGSNRGLVTSYSPLCTDSYDLESVMTHEWGHAYGLDHVTSSADADEVMYEYSTACALRRHLGEGDYEGMASLYGTKS